MSDNLDQVPGDFGDSSPDDTYTVGDEDVDWSKVEKLDSQIQSIQAIEDADERLAAAKSWASELNG